MPHSNASSQDWFYHSVTTKKGDVSKEPPPASQIPGLSTQPDGSECMDDEQFKRKWIRDTDSKYVKLAKAGGRKDLFKYKEHKPAPGGPQPYPRVDWFDHYHSNTDDDKELDPHSKKDRNQPTMPEWYVHDKNHTDEEKHESFERERPLLAYDDMSVWKREGHDGKTAAKQGRSNKPLRNTPHKPPPHVERPKPEKEDIHHLLSMGYQRDWLQEKEKQTQLEANSKKKSNKHQTKSQQPSFRSPKRDETNAKEEKPLFKMTRFTNIPPKINTFRS